MWIARNSDGFLYVYTRTPIKGNKGWIPSSDKEEPGCCNIPYRLFPEVQWDDDEPRELILNGSKKKKSDMTKEQIEKTAVAIKESLNYHMSFEDAQDYISKCGFDIPWNDGDVFVADREITRTIGNVLKWRINSVWHDAEEEPKQNAWFLAQIGDSAFDTFIMSIDSSRWDRWRNGFNIKRWAYIDDLLPERKEESI